MTPLFGNEEVVLFQGDSITDANRDRNNEIDLGAGYPAMIAAWFSALYPAKRVRFINKGISGNRVKDLFERWEVDCINLKPTWVSILAGINDTWRRYDSHDPTPANVFEENYRCILQQIVDRLDAKIIICEPFLLPVPDDRVAWREDLDPKIAVVRKLAREFGGVFIPLDGVFAQASVNRDPSFWLPDGVHPSPAGHALIAQAWLKAVGREIE
jgi:acyl-CoA thioesterase I